MRLLLFDNYDSFTYNLLHLIEKVSDCAVEVYRNDQIDLEKAGEFDRIIISPGPGVPQEAGILLPLIKKYAPHKPILGVCLGHQAIAEAFGARLINLDAVFHGISVPTEIIKEDTIFNSIPKNFKAGRYHSWAVDSRALPDCFEITAVDENNIIMAMRHKELNLKGVQFHPESILTEHGETILKNWLKE